MVVRAVTVQFPRTPIRIGAVCGFVEHWRIMHSPVVHDLVAVNLIECRITNIDLPSIREKRHGVGYECGEKRDRARCGGVRYGNGGDIAAMLWFRLALVPSPCDVGAGLPHARHRVGMQREEGLAVNGRNMHVLMHKFGLLSLGDSYRSTIPCKCAPWTPKPRRHWHGGITQI